MKGIIVNLKQGYGFIKPNESENEKENIFFYCGNLKEERFENIKLNQEVEFEVVESERGKKAINIEIISEL
jgi:cold shock CspA family protein